MTPEDRVKLAREIYEHQCEAEHEPSAAISGLARAAPDERPLGSPEAVRVALSRFVQAFMEGRQVDPESQAVVVKCLERVLDVDMDEERNHRGDLPKALGLVHDPHVYYQRRLHAATVFDLVDELRVEEGKRVAKSTAFERAATALRDAGVGDFSEDEIRSLYKLGFNM